MLPSSRGYQILQNSLSSPKESAEKSAEKSPSADHRKKKRVSFGETTIIPDDHKRKMRRVSADVTHSADDVTSSDVDNQVSADTATVDTSVTSESADDVKSADVDYDVMETASEHADCVHRQSYDLSMGEIGMQHVIQSADDVTSADVNKQLQVSADTDNDVIETASEHADRVHRQYYDLSMGEIGMKHVIQSADDDVTSADVSRQQEKPAGKWKYTYIFKNSLCIMS